VTVRRLYWWREALTVFVLYEVYSLIRNVSEGTKAEAYHHARQLMDWQHTLGINHEATLQSWALHSKPLIIFLNYVYGSLHFIITAGVVIWLYRRHPNVYPRWRNTLAFTTVLALVGFVFWPLMPPRLLATAGHGTYGFVDTLAKYPTFWSFDSGAMNKISNQYAAMPSLHFGWSLFCACALAPRLRRRGLQVAAALYPLLTLSAIVLTANHYFLDAVGGAVVFSAGYGISRRVTRRGPVLTDPETSGAPDAPEGDGLTPSPSTVRPLTN
jgi:hypothetical protein